MATQTALGSGSTNNNGGTALGVGSNGTQLSHLALGNEVMVTNKLVNDGDHSDEAYAAGVFAYDDTRPTAKGLDYTRGGVASGTLSPALVPALTQGVHRVEAVRTNRTATAIRAGYWDVYTGTWSTPVTDATDTFHKAVTGTTYVDYAVREQKVTYLVGNVPVNDVY